MSIVKGEKLNYLLKTIPEGVAVPSAWLTDQGYSPQLVKKYVQNGWLVKLATRLYMRPGGDLSWEGVLLGMQHFGELKWHLGGVSALNYQGMAHYLPLGGEAAIHVWGRDDSPPAWVNRLPQSAEWLFHRKQFFSGDPMLGLVGLPTRVRDWTLCASTPERALFEVLSMVDESISSFTFAAELYEGLTTAKPKLVSSLLDACTNNKIKRLFLFLASYYQYPWLKKIEVDGIDVGSGKRMVTRGGKLDKRYQITVPELYHAR